MQIVIPLFSLSVIVTCTTFSYVVTASEKISLSLSKRSSCDASSGPGLGTPILVQINNREVAIRISLYTFFKEKLVGGE